MSKEPLREPDGPPTTADPTDTDESPTDPSPAAKFGSVSFPLWAKIALPVASITILALGLGLGLGLDLKHHKSSKNSTSSINATAAADSWESIWSYGSSPAIYPSRTSLETSMSVPILHKLTTT